MLAISPSVLMIMTTPSLLIISTIFVDGIAQTYAQQVRMDWMSFRDEF